MTSLESFETILKDVVRPKRLSASKMGTLTEIALKSMADDTQLVSILYRTHKSLPSGSKIASLYVFDALARAARHQVTKHGLDPKSPNGNCATFLRKLEGVLEGLFQDMVSSGITESKEKSRKIVDIWTKGNTFPSAVLSRLDEIVKQAGKEIEVKPVPTTDPRASAQSQSISNTPAPTPPQPTVVPPIVSTNPSDPQTALLALLAQAANAAASPNGQISPNTQSAHGGTNAQMQLLQQLTRTAQLNTASIPSPLSQHHRPENHSAFSPAFGGGGPSRSRSPSTYRQPYPNSTPRESGFDRFEHSGRPRHRGGTYEDSRPPYRNSYSDLGRGGGYNNPSRFNRDDRSPPRRTRQSRSRSPPSRTVPGGVGRRDVRPYSPPRRPSFAPDAPDPHSPPRAVVTKGPGVSKDEFGRDIRSPSPLPRNERERSLTDTIPEPSPPRSLVSAVENTHTQMSLSPPVTANTSQSEGMETFDPSTFNPMEAASWENLGKRWKVTFGAVPSQQELMQFAMGGSAGPALSEVNAVAQAWQPPPAIAAWSAPAANVIQVWEGTNTQPSSGRGGYGGYSGSGGREQWARGSAAQETDAVVLGGGDSEEIVGDRGLAAMEISAGAPNGSGGGLGGRMQKVGEKWVFVRDAPAQ